MGRQGKNILNTTNNNRTPTKTSGSTTVRLEHPTIDEVEENDLKNNFKRIFEAFKEEIKIFLKEMEKKTNKNWKKSANPLKKTKKNNQTGERNSSKT